MGLSYAAVQSDEWINEWISLRPLEVGADKNESYNFVIRTRNFPQTRLKSELLF